AYCTGASTPEPLVRARPPADQSWWRCQSDFVERLDVRIPDAAADDAELRKYFAGADLQGRGIAPDRIRPPTRCALGDFRILLQRHRPQPSLPVPGVRCAWPGLQARVGRRPGDRALRQRAGADSDAATSLPQSAGLGRSGLPG